VEGRSLGGGGRGNDGAEKRQRKHRMGGRVTYRSTRDWTKKKIESLGRGIKSQEYIVYLRRVDSLSFETRRKCDIRGRGKIKRVALKK